MMRKIDKGFVGFRRRGEKEIHITPNKSYGVRITVPTMSQTRYDKIIDMDKRVAIFYFHPKGQYRHYIGKDGKIARFVDLPLSLAEDLWDVRVGEKTTLMKYIVPDEMVIVYRPDANIDIKEIVSEVRELYLKSKNDGGDGNAEGDGISAEGSKEA